MLDKLDKLEERINHFFTKGKNANERCFDFFLRSVTFFIILLAVLVYGGLVHASASTDSSFTDSINLDYFIDSSSVWSFFDTNYDSVYTNSTDMNLLFTNMLNPSPFNSDYIDLYSENFNNSQEAYSGNYSNKYMVLFCSSSPNSNLNGAINYFTILEIFSNDLPVLVDKATGYVDRGITDYCIYAPTGATVFEYSFGFSYNSFDGYRTQRFGYTTLDTLNSNNCIDLNSISYSQGKICYADIPVYSFVYSNVYDTQASDTRHFTTLTSFLEAIDNKEVYQLNPYDSVISPEPEPEVPTEGNANHMYFQNVRMCLSAQGENNNLSSSSLVIGCEVDDYIKNHMPEYKVYVSCQLNYKDSVYTYNPTYGEMLPLSLFYNQAYVKGLTEIFSNMPWQNLYPNFYSYYRHLGDDYNLFTKNVSGKNTRFEVPTITDVIQFTSGFFQTDKSVAHFPSNFDINTFQLDVSVVITDSDTLDTKSGVFKQRFDFLNGTTSILKADGLVNENPWTGPSEPQANPFGSGSTNANGGVIQNNNQNVNINIDNRFKNAVTGGVNDEDTDNTVDNMKKVFDEFKGGLKTISESSMDENGNPNGFLSLLEHTYNFIPGINYIKTAIIVIVALAVILFILKVLLF